MAVLVGNAAAFQWCGAGGWSFMSKPTNSRAQHGAWCAEFGEFGEGRPFRPPAVSNVRRRSKIRTSGHSKCVPVNIIQLTGFLFSANAGDSWYRPRTEWSCQTNSIRWVTAQIMWRFWESDVICSPSTFVLFFLNGVVFR